MNHNAYEFPLGILTGPVGFCFKPLTHSKPIEKPLCIYGSSTTDIPESHCLVLLGLVHLEASSHSDSQSDNNDNSGTLESSCPLLFLLFQRSETHVMKLTEAVLSVFLQVFKWNVQWLSCSALRHPNSHQVLDFGVQA